MILKSVRLAAQGAVSGAEYWLNYWSGRHQHPTFLIYQLTNNCNSRCRMCNIWQKESKGELTPREIQKALNKPMFRKLRWVNLTGGEPFLRDDIAEVVNLFNKLPEFEGVAIPSNGFLTDRIVQKAKAMLKVLGRGKFLSITLSIDGFEKTHDEIRGVRGAYRKVSNTLDRLLQLKQEHPNFNVGIQPTISRQNLDEIWRFYRHMKKKTKSIGFAVMMTSEGYYSNQGSRIALTASDKKKAAKILGKALIEDPQYGFYYSKLIELYNTGRRNFGCLAGNITLYMDPFGNLAPCPVLSCDKRYLFGNVKDRNPWFSRKALKMKQKLKNEPICQSCSMMCDFINVAKVEFYEHSLWMLMHPAMLTRLIDRISKEPNPYF